MRRELAELPTRYLKVIELGLVDRAVDAIKLISTWNNRGLFILSGGVGSGKTMAACCWIHGREGIFLTAAHLARWPRYDEEKMKRLLRTPSLVIDDLGTEYMDDKGNFWAVLDEVISYRYSNDFATLITTNLPVEDFRKRYGERIADRIRDNGKFVSIADSSRRHIETDIEKARIAQAEEKLRADRHENRERSLCRRHLYGPNEGVCNPDCPQFNREAAHPPLRDLIADLAEAKGMPKDKP